ncbi:MAG TPA: amidohydrolase family protein [Solirubrobacteraceae bacterium]|nr:amidohydrolase family protein [Solirubrobacteraceae bacterium]
MIFDAHVHPFPNFFSPVKMTAPGSELDAPEKLEALMAAEGIDGCLLLARDGDTLEHFLGRIPGAYGLFWTAPRPSPGSRYSSFVEETAHWLEHPKIVGIKLHPLVDAFDPSSRMLDGLYALSVERHVPILFHTGHEFGSLAWPIEVAARRHPRARFVLGHMGLSTLEYVDGAIEVASRNPNLFLETSGMPFTWKIKQAVEELGESRVMYGSDAPFFTPQLELEKVRLAGLNERQLARVLAANAIDLFLNGTPPPSA